MKYGTHNYNEQRFNINGVFHATALSETMTESDATQTVTALKLLLDALTPTDATIVFYNEQMLNDFVFFDETFQIQFTNKALNDTVRLADWLSIERNPAQNGWFD